MSDTGLVIFDLDYTLTKRGTWGRFVWMNVKSRPSVWLSLLRCVGIAQWRYKRGKIPRVQVKMAMMRCAMVGKTRAELTALADVFVEDTVANGLKPGAVKALQEHQARGDTIMIASAAVDIVVEPIAKRLGVKYFVATDMAWDERGRLKREFASKNCYGPQKLARIKDLILNSSELKTLKPILSYSDSKADMPLLTFTERGVAVDPKYKFRKHIKKHKTIHVDRWVA